MRVWLYFLVILQTQLFGQETRGCVVVCSKEEIKLLQESLYYLYDVLKSSLPIEVWLDDDVSFVCSNPMVKVRFFNHIHELEALHESCFSEVCLFKPGLIFFQDPNVVFTHTMYKKTGVFFFRYPFGEIKINKKRKSKCKKRLKPLLENLSIYTPEEFRDLQGQRQLLKKHRKIPFDGACLFINKHIHEETLCISQQYFKDVSLVDLNVIENIWLSLESLKVKYHTNFTFAFWKEFEDQITYMQYLAGKPFYERKIKCFNF